MSRVRFNHDWYYKQIDMVYRFNDDRPDVEMYDPDVTEGGDSAPKRAALRTISILPTIMTLGNVLCGFGAIFFASRPAQTLLPWGWSPLTYAASFIFLGMVFDGLDGRIARLTRNISDLGAQLDSMADMVTFGVAPAFLAVQLIGVETPFVSMVSDQMFDRVVVMVACIYVACTALRLARFNIIEAAQTTRSDPMSFEGLPSPGAAGTVASLVLLHQHFLVDGSPMDWSIRIASIGMVMIMWLAAFAMVSRLRYVHVVSRYLSGRARFGTIAKVVVLMLLLLTHIQGALAAGFVFYALSAPGLWLSRRVSRRYFARSGKP